MQPVIITAFDVTTCEFDDFFVANADFYHSRTGDDLITPVYVPPTRPPAVSKNVTRPGGKICENDDEDCLEGSGLPATEDPLTTAKGWNYFSSKNKSLLSQKGT